MQLSQLVLDFTTASLVWLAVVNAYLVFIES